MRRWTTSCGPLTPCTRTTPPLDREHHRQLIAPPRLPGYPSHVTLCVSVCVFCVVMCRSGTISWHEFLAATMDASMLDEEHIRLAFERIDTTHVGYITKYDPHKGTERGANECLCRWLLSGTYSSSVADVRPVFRVICGWHIGRTLRSCVVWT